VLPGHWRFQFQNLCENITGSRLGLAHIQGGENNEGRMETMWFEDRLATTIMRNVGDACVCYAAREMPSFGEFPTTHR